MKGAKINEVIPLPVTQWCIRKDHVVWCTQIGYLSPKTDRHLREHMLSSLSDWRNLYSQPSQTLLPLLLLLLLHPHGIYGLQSVSIVSHFCTRCIWKTNWVLITSINVYLILFFYQGLRKQKKRLNGNYKEVEYYFHPLTPTMSEVSGRVSSPWEALLQFICTIPKGTHTKNLENWAQGVK